MENETAVYNGLAFFSEELMPKIKKQEKTGTFGQRLAQLRKAAGLTQEELARELGTTRRMIAYYETEVDYQPAALFPKMAEILGVKTDELLGSKNGTDKTAKTKIPVTRLWKRFKQVEKLPPQEKKQIVQLVDALLERQKLKQQAA